MTDSKPGPLPNSERAFLYARTSRNGHERTQATARDHKVTINQGRRPRKHRDRDFPPDPWCSRGACGVGFVSRASGARSHDVLQLSLTALARLALALQIGHTPRCPQMLHGFTPCALR